MKPTFENTSDREIVIARVFHAPRALVWQAMTDPKHVTHWWGPRGFTTTTQVMDFRVGGRWEHTMHGPDGTDYPNKSVFQEIVPFERIVYAHGGRREDGPAATFVASWTFESLDAHRARLTLRMVFPSSEHRDRVVKEYGAIEGGKQTLERLAEYLPGLRASPFAITREFKAPRETMWALWTDQKHLEQWFGPKGFKTVVAKQDFRPGGIYHYCMKGPDGLEMWGRFAYREIVPPARLVWLNSFSDPEGGMVPPPFDGGPWPLQILIEVQFVERNGCTQVTVNSWPFDASEAEWRTFEANRPSMNQGWSGTLDKLAARLAET